MKTTVIKRLEEVSTNISLIFMFRAVVLIIKKDISTPEPRSRPRGSSRGNNYFNYEHLTRNLKHVHIFNDEMQTLPGILKGRHRRSDLQGKGKDEQRHANRTCK